MVLYANVGVRGELTTVTEYRNVSITALDAVMTTTVFPPEVPERTITLPAGDHTLTLAGGQAGSALRPFGPLENCYNTKQMTFEEAGLSRTVLTDEPQPAFRLTAQFDRACIAAPVPDMGASSLYELSYEGQSVALRNPQVCLYQRGPDRCSKIPAGGPWKGWSAYRTFVGPDPRAVETRLYLFGPRDLDGATQAVVEYRDVALRPVASPVDVVLVRQTATAAPATVDYDRTSAASFDVTMGDATPVDADGVGTYVALDESSAPGWTAQRAVGIDTAGKLPLQGWMNGWPATASEGSARLAYGPDRYAQLALKVFPLVLLAAVAWIVVRRPVRAWIGARWRRTRWGRRREVSS